MSLKRPRLKSSLPTRATLTPRRPRPQPAAAQEGASDGLSPGRPLRAMAGEGIRPAPGDTAARTTTSKRRLQRRTTPLEVLQEPLQAGIRKVFDLRRFLIVLGLTAGALLLPTPEGLTPAGHRALALFLFTGSILALEPAPLPIAALMVPIAQIALGIDTASGAFAPFGQPVLFLILGSLFLAEALNKHGLIRRIALYTIVFSGGKLHSLTFGLIVVSGLLSMWVLNTATVAVLIPVAITVAQRVEPQEQANRVLSLLLLAIAYSSSVGGMGTIMGSGENAIAAGLLDQIGDFGFLDWLKYGLPLTSVLLLLTWVLMRWTYPMTQVRINIEPAVREMERLGGLNAKEREILLVLAVSMSLWIAGSSLEGVFGLPDTLLSSAVVAIGAVALLSIEEIVDWNDLKSVNWGVFFVIGAGLSLGDALEKTGASTWFASRLAPSLDDLPYGMILTILVLLGFALTQLLNNVPLGAIFAPVLITLGDATGIAPVRLVIPTIMSIGLAYMLPGASARMTLVAVTGAVERKEMMRTGLIVGLPSALFVLVFFYGLSLLGLI
ncbi:MAG TPA: DASS family sodium-coupled anion symporter [Caldilineaceae bacterium]|nr:DASS family sodium-coupled anion symporter [Caldilineaceae bacterium]